MTKTQHPTLETLSGYILSPQHQDYREVRQHLVSCEQCRLRSDRLGALTRQLQRQVPLIKTGNTEQAEHDLPELDGQPLTAAQLSTVKQSPAALKAALHRLTHSAAMQRDLQAARAERSHSTSVGTTKVERKQQKGLAQRLQQWFSGANPAWLGVPVTAVLVFALTVTLMPSFNQSGNVLVTAYQDNPVVSFQPAGAQRPGIGFFSNVPSSNQPFTPVQISVQDNDTLLLQWPAIANAVDYTVQVAMIEGETHVQLLQQITDKPQIRFTAFTPRKGKRYTWTISGRTRDGQRFRAEGGFVIQ